MSPADAVAAAEAALAAAKEAAAKEAAVVAAAKEETAAAPVSDPSTPEDSSELEEDVSEITTEDNAAGVGLSTSVDDTGYQSDTTQACESPSDEEEETVLIDCSLDGICYSRTADGTVNDDEDEPVGNWVDGKIEFSSVGKRLHRTKLASM